MKRFEYVDTLYNPKYIDLLSEVSEDQRNIISLLRGLHMKMLIPVLDKDGKPVPVIDPQGQPVLDLDGRPLYQTRGGLPGVMKICENFLRLNVSYGRQGRKEIVRILEPKAANIHANSFSADYKRDKGLSGILGGNK